MNVIDLRSDTVSPPTEEMRRAMYRAELGDDVYGEDTTVNRLEALAAGMLGKEAALFTASGTMSNLIAVLTHTQPGDEILVGSESYMLWADSGGASTLGRVVVRALPNNQNGQIEPKVLKGAMRPENIHYPRTSLLCLENTHNRLGGCVLTPEYTAAISELAHQGGLEVFLDGARVFNAAVALDVPTSELTEPADSVCFCICKGLSAPAGSLLCGTRDFIARTRKWRKMLGGGMRQAGVLAAAGIVALDTMIDRLAEDHITAQHLAEGLNQIPGIILRAEKVPTNIVMFQLPEMVPGWEFTTRLEKRGVRLSHRGRTVRAATHRLISNTDIDQALKHIASVIRELSREKSG